MTTDIKEQVEVSQNVEGSTAESTVRIQRPIRFKLAPETFNRALNAAQFVADVAAKSENQVMESAANACIAEVMNNSVVLNKHINKETRSVELVSFVASESTLRNLFSVMELAADAHANGYRRNYAALLIERYVERQREQIKAHMELNREIYAQWREHLKENGVGYNIDTRNLELEEDQKAALKEMRKQFCEKRGISESRLLSAIQFCQNEETKRRRGGTFELPKDGSADSEMKKVADYDPLGEER